MVVSRGMIAMAVGIVIVIIVFVIILRMRPRCEECICRTVTLMPESPSSNDIDKIQVYDDIISPIILEKVVKMINNRGFKYGWKSDVELDYGHWNMQMASKHISSKKNKKVENIEPFLPPEIVQVTKVLKKTFNLENAITDRCYSNAYTFGTEGYVHYDSNNNRDITVIIFLNNEWKENWFGETVFLDSKGEIVKAVLPRFGRCVVFPGNIAHAGRSVSRICNVARTILVVKFHLPKS